MPRFGLCDDSWSTTNILKLGLNPERVSEEKKSEKVISSDDIILFSKNGINASFLVLYSIMSSTGTVSFKTKMEESLAEYALCFSLSSFFSIRFSGSLFKSNMVRV